MATIHHLSMALVDVQERLVKELQFTADAERQAEAAFDTVFESLHHLQETVKAGFAERRRALSAALGNPGPSPETIEPDLSELMRKPKLVKAAAVGGEA